MWIKFWATCFVAGVGGYGIGYLVPGAWGALVAFIWGVGCGLAFLRWERNFVGTTNV